MTSKVPLTLDTSANTIQELPSGDDLDLSNSNISAVGNITAGNSITANYFVGTLYGNANNATTADSATTAGTVTTNAQPNVTSVGTLTSLTVSGTSNLDNISNVKISGGSANQLIATDGSGNLSFTTVQGDSFMLDPVRAGTTNNITLSGTQTIDGISLQVGDRVLVRRQTNAVDNGIYIVASGAWTRATDFDTGAATLQGGVTVTVQSGTYLQGVVFYCGNTTTITIGSTSISWLRVVGEAGLFSVWTSGGAFDEKANASGSGAIAVGLSAKAGTDATALGYNANAVDRSVAIGYGTIASSSSSVAVGLDAKAGSQSVSMGRSVCINATGYPAECVDIGYQAARISNTAASRRVSVGYMAHEQNPNANSVAVGYAAGRNGAHANTIILNATGANLDSTGASRMFAKPVREVTDITGLKALYYDPSTGEIVYYTP